jgi:hypothetical protein
MYAPYYTVAAGWQTTLGLNNATRVPIVVNPTLYSLDGAGAPLPSIRLEAHETIG